MHSESRPTCRSLSGIRIAQLGLGLGLMLVALLLPALDPAPARAMTFTVTTLNDDGDGSLRQAIAAANSSGGSNLIVFQSGLNGTIHLGDTLKVTAGNLTIRGPGRGSLTIDGGNTVQPFRVDPGVQLTLEELTIAKGLAPDHGGAIHNNQGTVTIQNCDFRSNDAGDGGSGGAIYSYYGDLSIAGSYFYDNTAQENGIITNTHGGAIYHEGGDLSITESTFDTNFVGDNGGAVYHYWGHFTLTRSSFFENGSDDGYGGAIYLDKATTNVSATDFHFNSTYDRGGAIYVDGGELNFIGSLLERNDSKGYGGAIYSDDAVITIINSSIVQNTADGNYGGGAIYHDGDSLTIKNSTFKDNASGNLGALFIDDGTAILQNVLMANSSTTSRSCSGAFFDQGGNFSEDASCNFTPSSHNGVNLMLGPLESFDMWTPPYMVPQPGSPAIGGGVNCPPPMTDQRGHPRSAPCDSGAVETDHVSDGPTLQRIDPTEGPAGGGTTVTLYGTGFSTDPGATVVHFGSNTATKVSCASTVRCTATSPPGQGRVNVWVTVAGKSSPVTEDTQFAYHRTPPPDALEANITGCDPHGAPSCILQIRLGSGAPEGTALRVDIRGATYPKSGMPSVSSSGCANTPMAGTYQAVNGSYTRYQLKIIAGGCGPGAIITLIQGVNAAPGALIVQTISSPTLGTVAASITYPGSTAAPPASAPSPLRRPNPSR